jgi:hypothetical protein
LFIAGVAEAAKMTVEILDEHAGFGGQLTSLPERLRGICQRLTPCDLWGQPFGSRIRHLHGKNSFVISVARQETRRQSHRHMTRSLATYRGGGGRTQQLQQERREGHASCRM